MAPDQIEQALDLLTRRVECLEDALVRHGILIPDPGLPPYVEGRGAKVLDRNELLEAWRREGGIVSQDGDQVRLVRSGATEEANKTVTKTEAVEDNPLRASVSTTFASQPAGVVAFNISVKVDMADFAGWEPTRITAFFAGIAQVLAAKGNVEEKTAKT